MKKDTAKKPKDSAKPPKPPPKPAELDQDPGGGYNPDHTFPQNVTGKQWGDSQLFHQFFSRGNW